MSRVTAVIREDAAAVAASLESRLGELSGAVLLVSGASGFLCSNFLDLVAAWNERSGRAPCRVLALDNHRSGLPERTAHLRDREEFKFIDCDLSQPLALEREVDFIIHGASIASPPVYRRFPLETVDVNVVGTRQMLELARRGARSMLFLSTSEIYGDPEPRWIPTPETYRGNVSCTGPRACYDEGKRLGETLCTIYHRSFGTPVKIARPFNVYGPGQRLDDGRIIPDLMRAALAREPLVLFSDGSATRAFCYVTDAIRGMLYVLLSDADGEAFNVGNDQVESSIREVTEVVRDSAGPPPLEIRLAASGDADYLTDNPRRRCPDLRKLRALADWRPEVDLKTGIERVLRSYREAQAEGPR